MDSPETTASNAGGGGAATWGCNLTRSSGLHFRKAQLLLFVRHVRVICRHGKPWQALFLVQVCAGVWNPISYALSLFAFFLPVGTKDSHAPRSMILGCMVSLVHGPFPSCPSGRVLFKMSRSFTGPNCCRPAPLSQNRCLCKLYTSTFHTYICVSMCVSEYTYTHTRNYMTA